VIYLFATGGFVWQICNCFYYIWCCWSDVDVWSTW